MTLAVPLTVRVGEHHVTSQLRSLSFRREAVGGVRSISFSLARPLSDLTGMDPLAKVYVYDGRTAETVAEGRLADSGRTADQGGESWDCLAFGPGQHASDVTRPLVYIDTDRGHLRPVAVRSIEGTAGDAPSPADDYPGVLLAFGDGASVATNGHVAVIYEAVNEAGMKLARINYSWDAGVTDGTWRLRTRTYEGSTAGPQENVRDDGANTAGGGTVPRVVVTDWTNGRDLFAFVWVWTGGAGVVGGDDKWAHVRDFVVLSMLVDKSGAEVTSGYTGDAVIASQVVEDLLGRCLPEFDGAGATVEATSTGISQLAYLDGVTPEQVLADLMTIEPAYRWTTTPDTTGDGYGFRWEPWPTTVRYEATLEDGGTFPLSTQDLYNQVSVRWRDASGVTRSTLRTLACQILDDNGLTRRAQIDLGGELGTQAQAEAAGDAFLDDHNVPKNGGTLTVARPIRDVITNKLVQPWEIEPGELVRVRGVEAYPDAMNADTNDGRAVFRIFALDYASDGNTATLALDADPRDTADALVKLANRRDRR